jgi:flagellar biosynthesis protein FliR
MNPFDTTAGLALLLVRPGMLVVGTPFFGNVYAPTHARIGLTLLLALTLAPFVHMPGTLTGGSLALVVLREVAIGLSMGALIDPQSGVRNDLLALMYSNLAIIICLSTNAHHMLLRALADSYTALPIGLGGIAASLTGSVTQLLGLVFLMGVRLALPVIVMLGLVELALALIARVAPSLNVLVAGAPVRVIIGLLAVAATLGALPSLVARYLPDALTFAAEVARAFR